MMCSCIRAMIKCKIIRTRHDQRVNETGKRAAYFIILAKVQKTITVNKQGKNVIEK